IATVWREVLERAEVDVDDNFFDLGGHSLLLLRLQHRLQTALGHPVSLVELFQYPTVAAFVAHETQRSAVRPSGVAVAADRSADDAAIAVIGMAGRFPGADSVEEFWQLLRAGREGIT